MSCFQTSSQTLLCFSHCCSRGAPHPSAGAVGRRAHPTQGRAGLKSHGEKGWEGDPRGQPTRRRKINQPHSDLHSGVCSFLQTHSFTTAAQRTLGMLNRVKGSRTFLWKDVSFFSELPPSALPESTRDAARVSASLTPSVRFCSGLGRAGQQQASTQHHLRQQSLFHPRPFLCDHPLVPAQCCSHVLKWGWLRGK